MGGGLGLRGKLSFGSVVCGSGSVVGVFGFISVHEKKWESVWWVD